MLKVSLRNLLAHKLRLVLTVAAITLGVSFVTGTFVLSDTMGKAFDQLFTGLAKGTDVTVRSKAAYTDAASQGQMRPLDEHLVDRVKAVPGVAGAEGGLTGYALILDKDGKPIQPGGAPTLGAGMHSDRALASGFSLRAGAPPVRPDEVALDAATVKKAGFRVGDPVTVVFQDGTERFTMVGVVGFGESDSLAGATLATFEMHTAQKLLGKPGQVDEIDVRAAPGITSAQLRDRVAEALPSGVEAITAQQSSDESSRAVRDGLGIFTKILLAFAAVSLMVGSFVIWNTFNVLVAQRRREVALLRAVGATRRQVLGGIVVEAVVVGLLSAAAGVGVGVGMAVGIRALLGAIGVEVPTTTAVVAPRTIIAALIVGVGVTVVAAVVPALGATRVAPVEALRDATPASGRIGTLRRVLGAVLLAAGAAGLAVAIIAEGQPLLTGMSALVAFAGLVTAGPLLARGMARLADRGRPGGGWRLAARNVSRAPQRASATALALTIGLAVVCAVTVTAASTKASVADSVSGGNRSDLILKPSAGGGGISPAVATILRNRQDVGTVVEMRYAGARVNGQGAAVAGLDTAGVDKIANLGIGSGSLADFGPGTMLLSRKQAAALGARVGDPVTVTLPETGPLTVKVAATFERESLIGSGYVLSLPDFAQHVTSRLDQAILVKAAPGADRATTKAAVTKALAAYPNVKVSDPADLTKDAQASVDELLGLVTALLLLAVVVAVLGIVNTLVLSVVERTRELGLMRAVGASRRQVRSVIRRESLLMSLLGALAGVGLGSAAGVALARSLAGEGITSLSVPVGTLLGYVVVAALVGILAAIGPARRASRIDVLRAITVE